MKTIRQKLKGVNTSISSHSEACAELVSVLFRNLAVPFSNKISPFEKGPLIQSPPLEKGDIRGFDKDLFFNLCNLILKSV